MSKVNKFLKITLVASILWAVVSCSGGRSNSESEGPEVKLSANYSTATLGWPLD